MNVYRDPWLLKANAAILAARQATAQRCEVTGRFLAGEPAAAEPAPEFAHLTHGTMTAYKRGCRCAACWRRNYERGRRQRQARRQREAGVAA